MVKVTYIFSGGRKEKFNSSDIQAKEHYYGLPYISEKNINLEIIEFNETVSNFSFIFRLFDKIMNKFISLPFYTARVTTFSNIKKILSSNYVVIVNESTGCPLFFLLIIAKYFSRVNVSIFIMGLYIQKIILSKLLQ